MSSIDWRPEIGDPTPMGWITVVAYFLAAASCLAAHVRSGSITGLTNPLRAPWLLLGLLLMALGFNKQLDFQSLVTETGRFAIRAFSLYEYRRFLQVSFVLVVLAIAAVAMWYSLQATRGRFQEYRLSLAGVVFLLGFIVIRAASFHGFDRLLDVRPLGVRLNWVLELGGIALIFAGAWRNLTKGSG
jgi:hypothetical protein